MNAAILVTISQFADLAMTLWSRFQQRKLDRAQLSALELFEKAQADNLKVSDLVKLTREEAARQKAGLVANIAHVDAQAPVELRQLEALHAQLGAQIEELRRVSQ